LAAFLIRRAIPRGTLGAVKIAHAGHSGQLGSGPKDATIPSDSPRQLLIGVAKVVTKFARAQLFSFLPRTRAFRFSSQEDFFSAIKNKIHFFLVDFETGF
jgi:hypothetical protein